MLGYSSSILFNVKRINVIFFLFLISFIVCLFSSCKEDVPTQPGEQFDLSIITPHDSSFVLQSLRVELSTTGDNNIKQVSFFIDNITVASDPLGNNVFIVDVSDFSDDNFHKIRVIAVNESGAVGYSKTISLKIFKSAKYTISLISPNNQFIERFNNKVELSWLPSAAFSKTVVEISKSYFFNDILFTGVAFGRKFITPDLQLGDYYWRLKVDFKDTSLTQYSESRNFEIAGPLAPALVSPFNNEITSGIGDITFSWTKSGGAVQYDLLVLDDESKDTVLNETVDSDTVLKRSLPLSAYACKVRAKNIAGNWGEWSNQSRFGHGVFYKIVDVNAMLVPHQIKKHNDGNYIISARSLIDPYSHIIKINPSGTTLWSKSFENTRINSFEVLNDGSLILAGEDSYIMPVFIRNSKVTKLDPSGNTLWENILSNNNKESILDIKPVADGYVSVGYQMDSLISNSFPMILKVSLSGDLIYRKLFSLGNPIRNKLFIDNTDLVTFGYNTGFSNTIAFVKYDAQGNELLNKNFSGWLNLRGAKKLFDGTLLIGGSVTSNYGMFIKKIDTNGEVIIESEFNIAIPSAIYDVEGSTNDDCFITGYSRNSGQQDGIYFAKLDATGNVAAEKHYPGEGGYTLISTDDGGVLIIGHINNGVMCIIKTNRDGVTFYPQ